MGEMIRKIKGNLGRYFLYLLGQVVVIACQFTIFNQGAPEVIAERSLRSASRVSLLGSIIIFFIAPLLAGYLATINKNVLSGSRKKFGEELSEGISYYWSILGGSLLIGIMIFGVVIGSILVMFIPVLGILGAIVGVIFIIYLGVRYSAIAEAIVFREYGVSEGMDTCKEVAREHFGELFLVCIPLVILNIISSVVGGIVVLVSISIITMLYSIFASYYRITLVSSICGGDNNEVTGEKEDGYPGM